MLDLWNTELLVVVNVVLKCYLVPQNWNKIAFRGRDVFLLFQLDVHASIRRSGQLVERFNALLSNGIPRVFVQVYVHLAIR